MKGIISRLTIGGAVIAALSTLVVMPASAAPAALKAPKVDVAAPAAHAYFRRGSIYVSGVACDPDAATADSTAGISKVSVFLGDRDTTEAVPFFRPGGYLGAATVAGTNADFSSTGAINSRLALNTPEFNTCKQPNSGFRVLTGAIRKGTWTMNIYVQGKNGAETKVTIPGIRIDKP